MQGGSDPGLVLMNAEDVLYDDQDDNKANPLYQPEPHSPSSQSVMGGLVWDMGRLGSELATLRRRIADQHLHSPHTVPANGGPGTHHSFSDLAPGIVGVLDGSGRGCHTGGLN